MLQTTTFTLHNTVAGFCYTDSDAVDQKRNIGVIQNAGMLFADAGFGEMEQVKMGPIVRFWESQYESAFDFFA